MTVPAMRLHEGKPHYTWLPLQKRSDKDNVSGEVHLRMQWVSQELDIPADAALNLAVDVQLHGIGLSVVESSVKALPREVILCQTASDIVPGQAVASIVRHGTRSCSHE